MPGGESGILIMSASWLLCVRVSSTIISYKVNHQHGVGSMQSVIFQHVMGDAQLKY